MATTGRDAGDRRQRPDSPSDRHEHGQGRRLGYGQSRQCDDRPRGQARAAQRRRRAAGRDRTLDARRQPGKYTTCFAEWEERSPWEPLHVERGFRARGQRGDGLRPRSGVAPIVDQLSRTAHAPGGSSRDGRSRACWHPKQHGYGEILLVVSPEHADTITRDGWSKAQVRSRIQEVSARPIRELVARRQRAARGWRCGNSASSDPTPEQLEAAHSEVPQAREHQYHRGGRRGR